MTGKHIDRALMALLAGVSGTALQAQTAAPAAVQSAAPAAADMEADEEIVVTGQKPRGSVVGDIQPEIQFSQADVRAYGVSSIGDLLDQLAPQTGSARGRGGAPVVLLEGRRISGFQEIRDIPTEAITRVEILPEEVALKYGYAADQRVVNIVLRQFFRSVVTEAGGGMATEGGGENGQGNLNLLRIGNGKRINIDAKVNHNAWLTEEDRDVISRTNGQLYSYDGNVAGVSGAPLNLGSTTATSAAIPQAAVNGARPALADFLPTAGAPSINNTADTRTLRPRSSQMSLNGVYAQPIGKVSASFNGRYDYSRTLSLQGPATSLVTVPVGNPASPFSQPVSVYRYLGDDPLRQRVTTGTAHAGMTFNGDFAPFRWNVTGNFDRVDTRTRTDRGYDQTAYQARITANDATLNPFARLTPSVLGPAITDTAHSVSNRGDLMALLSGPIGDLPAGTINSTFRVGGTATGFSSDSLRSGVAQSTDLSRQTGSAQLNVDFPIASRRRDVLGFLGELSVNGNVAVEKVSDFGTLTSYGAGANWTPITKLRLIGSFTRDQTAPTVQQLGNPTITTAGVRVFDYRQGTTVDVVQVSGGNPNLNSDTRDVFKLGAQFKPFTSRDLNLSANFVSQRIRNQVSNLPAATLEIEAAFPDRFTRTNGILTRVDSRAVNFAREDRQTLRLGIDLSISLKPSAALQERQREAFRAEFEKRRAAAAARGETLPAPPFAGPGGQRQQGQQQQANQTPQGGANVPPPPGDGLPPPPAQTATGTAGAGDRAPGGGGAPGGGFGGPGGPGGPGGFGPPGGGRGPGGGNQAGGRIQLALYDNWTLKDKILIRPGVPVLDLLDGASIGTGGGIARHQIQAQLGYNNNGLGLRFEGNYNTGTTVNAGAGSTTGDLRFSPLTTVNFRLFANLQQLPPLIGKEWARGARLTVSVNNIFNERQKVRDTLGTTPLSYQPAYLDALGRNFRITFRKLFFSIPRRPPQQRAAGE